MCQVYLALGSRVEKNTLAFFPLVAEWVTFNLLDFWGLYIPTILEGAPNPRTPKDLIEDPGFSK